MSEEITVPSYCDATDKEAERTARVVYDAITIGHASRRLTEAAPENNYLPRGWL